MSFLGCLDARFFLEFFDPNGRIVLSEQFDVEAFLATVNGGRTILNYCENQVVFTQGHLEE